MADEKNTAPKRKLTYEESLARARARGSEKKDEQQVEKEKRKLALPPWPVAMRGVPNGFLRSALFGAIAKGPRRYMEGELIAAVDGVEIRCTGKRLDQGDLDVWASVLHSVRLQKLGNQCRTNSYALLRMQGKTDSGKNRKLLQQRIERLRANAVTVKQDRYIYIGGLISFAGKDEDTQEWVIEIDVKLQPLFSADQFTQIEWSVRSALAGKPLAQWLHGFYSSHAKPYPINVPTLCKLSGSENEDMSSWKQTLRKALDALKAASEANGQHFSYEIRGDLVHVERQPSESQQRHLDKKAIKPRKPRKPLI